MWYVIRCVDAPGVERIKAAAQAAHQEYVARHKAVMLLGGPLLSDDGKAYVGSLFVIHAASRRQAQAFVDAEPYQRAGVFSQVDIDPFGPAVVNESLKNTWGNTK